MYPIQNQEKYGRGFPFKRLYPTGWGKLTGSPHLGIDIQCPVGTPIYASFDGVIKNSEGSESGYAVALSNSRYTVRHFHLSKQITPGNVKKGAIIGYTGGKKGAEGSGTSSGPHIHIDISLGKPQIKNIDNFIDPDDFFQEIRVLVVGADDYNLTDVIAENPYLSITKKIKDLTPKWIQRDNETEIDENWFDLNVWEAGYDIVAFITKDYQKADSLGYAENKQRLGTYRCVVSDTGKPRNKGKGWRKDNQIAGTLEHEIYHLLHRGVGTTDMTHELDKGEGFPVLALSRFKGFELKDKIRLFKKSFYTGNAKERIVNKDSFIPSLYERFGFKKSL